MINNNFNYIIRLARKDDCKALAKLKQQVWHETYRGIYKDSIIDNFDFVSAEETFKQILDNNQISLYVVESENVLAGYMSVGKPLRSFRNYNCEIGLLYLKKSFQKMGIGKLLFNMAKEEIKKRGYKTFFVSCNKYNTPARAFYEKMGGVLVHEDEDSIEDKRPIQVKYHYEV